MFLSSDQNTKVFGNVLVEAAMFKLNIISSNCNAGPKKKY